MKWPRTCVVASRVTWPRVWRGRDALPRVRRSTSVDREYANKHARKASWGVPEVQCRRARGAQPYRAAYPRMCSRRATAVARERNPTAPHAQECVPEVQRRSARERNPTTPHTQECVPNVQRRSLTHSADGGDRTHTLLPVLDFESSASANSATSAFCEEETTKPFATKRKRQRRQLATLKQMHKSRKQESGVAGVAGVQEFRPKVLDGVE